MCPKSGVPDFGSIHQLHDGSFVCNIHAVCSVQAAGRKCAGAAPPGLVNVNGVLVHAFGECNRCAGCGEFTNYDAERKAVDGKIYCPMCEFCPKCHTHISVHPLRVSTGKEVVIWHAKCAICETCGTAYNESLSGVWKMDAVNGLQCPDCINCDVCPMKIEDVRATVTVNASGDGDLWAHPQCRIMIRKRKHEGE